jgi:2-C-methyl-D-erythritol 2,4-cyclodiphosphate synthase
MHRIGTGSDVHRLVAGRPLLIGGVRIDSGLGADGHSDADVLLHAITDAVLGALALGDIGTHFPNSDPRWKGADSLLFLSRAVEMASEHGYVVGNIDSTVSLETPKLSPYIDAIRASIAAAARIDHSCVSVKAKTGEGMDAVGQKAAVRADAVVLLSRSTTEEL